MAKIDRASITAAALAIVDRDESTPLTLSAIARELDVTQPALYHHASGLEEVLRWIGIAVREQLHSELSHAAVGLSCDDAVRAVSNVWRSFSRDHPALYKSTDLHPVAGDAELEDAVDQILIVLAASFRGFDLDDENRSNAALALRSALHGFCSFELGAGNPSPQSADDSFISVVSLLLRGVAASARVLSP